MKKILFAMVFACMMICTSLYAYGERRIISGHVPDDIRHSTRTGELARGTRIRLTIGLPLRDKEGLEKFINDVYDPKNPLYRHYLTGMEFTVKFGPKPGDYEKLSEFIKAKGLNITNTFSNSAVLEAEGSVEAIEAAFNVRLYTYARDDGTVFYAPDTEPYADLDIPILHISGLDSAARFTSMAFTGSAPGGNFMGYDYRNAYAPGVTLDGSGQIVGIFSWSNYYSDDILTYETLAGLPNVPITNKYIGGITSATSPSSYNSETAGDIEQVISMAPGCAVYVYTGPITSAGYDATLAQMAADTEVNQFTSSIAISPIDATANALYAQLAAQGQAFFHASGDSGAYALSSTAGSDDEPLYITQVGGTDLSTASDAWVSETTWNNSYGKSGGGICTVSIPVYQQGLSMASNYGSTAYKNSPDVSIVGTGAYILYDNGSEGSGSGTSYASPLWAGFCALVNQQAAIIGNPPAGFLNPALYAIGQGPNYAADFHDITTGNNGTATKYPAVAGYDLCTGWGSPKGMSLINDLAGPTHTATPSFTSTSTITETRTPTSSSTKTVTPSLSCTNSATFTVTATSTITATFASTLTHTPSFTQTHTPSFTLTTTATFTHSVTLTSTLTGTPSYTTGTRTASPTATSADTNTFTPTSTLTLTPTVTPAGPAPASGITDIMVYPNPYFFADNLNINFEIHPANNGIVFNLYTSGFRRILKMSIPGNYEGKCRITIPKNFLEGFQSGTYYYYLEGKNTKNVKIRSTAGVIIILR